MAYGIPERAFLIALASLGGSAANNHLVKVYKINPDAKKRKQLVSDDLVYTKVVAGRRLDHTLTDLGWSWVASEMEADLPARPGSAGGALYALLRGLREPAERAGGLRNLIRAEFGGGADLSPPRASPPTDLPQQVHDAYDRLKVRRGDWVWLVDLRLELGGTKAEQDAALKEMYLAKEINLTEADDQRGLKARDDTFVLVGITKMQRVSIE